MQTDERVLIVDDDAFYRDILCDTLEEAGYASLCAENGLQAWQLLSSEPKRFDAVLLDRLMPEMDGMEVLARLKEHPSLQLLPVIMQTSMAGREDVIEGLRAGANYYLTKPFQRDKLLAIVKTAVGDHRRVRSLQQETEQTVQTLAMMDQGRFTFRTLKQGRDLVTLLSNAFPEAGKIVMGLSELVINAIEHGNLGITYEEKSRMIERGDWGEEVERRQSLPENVDKTVSLSFERSEGEVEFRIQDQGNGFDWHDYLEMSPERAFDTHGRGIALAKIVSFDRLEYQGKGNLVIASVRITT